MERGDVVDAPQWTLIVLAASELMFAAYCHGKERPTGPKVNFWHYFFGCALYMAILFWGGFFR